MNPPNNPPKPDQRPAATGRTLALDMVLAIVIPLIDLAAAQWLRWRSSKTTGKGSADDASSDVVRPSGGPSMPVSDVRGRQGTATTPTGPGIGLPNWRSDPRKTADDQADI